jgi:hypothetical protein
MNRHFAKVIQVQIDEKLFNIMRYQGNTTKNTDTHVLNELILKD